MKRPGDPITFTRHWWVGPEPVSGDGLRTATGRQYLVLAVRGNRLDCMVIEKDERIPGTIFEWEWKKR